MYNQPYVNWELAVSENGRKWTPDFNLAILEGDIHE